MSPSARQFEPAAKRQSSAIRIVNPETQAPLDLHGVKTATPTPATSSPSSRAPSTSGVKPGTSPSPTVAVAPERKPVRMETHEAWIARVQKEKEEKDAKKKREAEEKAKREAEEQAGKSAEEEAAAAAAAAAQKEQEEEDAAAAVEAEKKAKEEAAERERQAKADEEAAAKREAEEKAAAERKAAEEAEAEAAAAAAAAAKREAEQKEHEAKEEAERKEREAKEAAEAEEKAARAKAEAEAEASAKRRAAEDEAREREEAKAREEVQSKAPAPIDTSKAVEYGKEEALLAAEEKVTSEAKTGAEAAKEATGPSAVRNYAAEVERMAREASSVPSTPLNDVPPRTPGIPSTPRTPGTPGFAGLPAKPLSSIPAPTNNGIKLDGDALEKRKRPVPGALDLSTVNRSASGDALPSAAASALGSARIIDNINKVSYPDGIMSPKAELNEQAEPGKFRYDRDFLLQFMGVYKEKPQDLPPLAAIGMEAGGAGNSRSSMGNRRSSGMGPPPPPGRAGAGAGAPTGLGIGIGGPGSAFGGKGGAGGMGQFSYTPKTSEERFAAASGMRPGSSGAFGSGPMGSFNAGARSQPLSRTGSGSNALPPRDGAGRTKSNRGRQRDPNSSRGGPQVNPPDKGGPTIPMDQVAPLANSENRWVPQAIGGRAAAGGPKPDSPEMVQRKVKSLLNKLTLEKFDSITDQILEWANKSVNENDGRTLRQVIALTFEKATDEAAWSEMYARLCRKLMGCLSPEVTDESLKTSDGKPVVGGSLFRKYLLNRCQEDFERGWAHRDATIAAAKNKEAEDKAKKDANEKAEAEAKEAAERGETPKSEPKEAELLSDEYYEAQKAKRRGLGLVRFIGELFKLNMLTERIMHLCIKKLLSNAKDPEEEEIESLCKLLTTVGKLLDTEKARGHMDVYFQRMNEMANNDNINSRMRFMLLVSRLTVLRARAFVLLDAQRLSSPLSRRMSLSCATATGHQGTTTRLRRRSLRFTKMCVSCRAVLCRLPFG